MMKLKFSILIFSILIASLSLGTNAFAEFADRSVDRAQQFPEYYNALETKCLSTAKKSDVQLVRGRVERRFSKTSWAGWSGGFTKSLGGLYFVYDDGKYGREYSVRDDDVVYLNNTNPSGSEAWVSLDSAREMAVLLDLTTCQAIGEVPYYELKN